MRTTKKKPLENHANGFTFLFSPASHRGNLQITIMEKPRTARSRGRDATSKSPRRRDRTSLFTMSRLALGASSTYDNQRRATREDLAQRVALRRCKYTTHEDDVRCLRPATSCYDAVACITDAVDAASPRKTNFVVLPSDRIWRERFRDQFIPGITLFLLLVYHFYISFNRITVYADVSEVFKIIRGGFITKTRSYVVFVVKDFCVFSFIIVFKYKEAEILSNDSSLNSFQFHL